MGGSGSKGLPEKVMPLFGPSNSGKSTFLNQVRLRRLGGFKDEQRHGVLDMIRDRILYWTYTLGQLENLSLGEDSEVVLSAPLNLFAKGENRELAIKMLPLMVKVWAPGSPFCVHFESMPLMSSFQMEKTESDERIMSRVAQLCQEDYVASDDDILYFRVMTAGDPEPITYNHENLINLTFVDLGGQRLERSKWKNVKDPWGVVFVVGIDCYSRIDEGSGLNALGEKCKKSNGKISALQDGIDCCKGIAKQCIEAKVPMILLLNKVDLFEKNFAKGDFGKYFPAFKGGDDFEKAKEFVEALFLKKVDSNFKKSELFHTHFITMVDGDAVEKILQTVQSLVTRRNLAKSFRE